MTSVESSGVNVNEWKAAGKILIRAKELIQTRGWQQDAPTHVEFECLATALEHAFEEGGFTIVDFNYAREALARTLKINREPIKEVNDPLDVPYWGKSLMDWNDAPGRTEAEVLDALQNAAALSAQLSKQ